MKTFILHLTTILLSVLSGFIVAVAFPPWNQSWFIWAGFIPVLSGLLLFSRNWLLSLLRGAAFGGTFAGFLFSWLLTGGHLADWLTNTASLALLGGIWGLFVGLLVQLPAKSGEKKLSPILPGYGFNSGGWSKSMAHLRAALIAAAGWTVLEWARGVLLPGWNAVGTVLQANLPLFQIVTITGVSGLTFMAVFANVIVLTTVRWLVLEPSRMITWADRFDVTATLGIVFLSALAGFWSLQRRSGNETGNVALVCPPGTQFSRLLELSKVANADGIDLFVWRCVRFERGDYAAAGDASIGKTAALVTGVTNAENGSLNGATVIVPGSVKNVLVMPIHRDFFQFGIGSSGRTLNPFEFNNVSCVPLLNWEAGDPLLIKSTIKGQVQLLVAFFDPAILSRAGLEQLFANLRAWAVSLGRPLIFASVRDLSVIMSGSGRFAGARSTPEPDILIGRVEIPAANELTVYGRYGDWFAIACGVLGIFTAFSERLRRHYEKSGRLTA